MKIKIVKPSNKSGYFKDEVVKIDQKQLEAIKELNDIEVLVEVNDNQVNRKEKSKNTNTRGSKRTSKPS